MRKLFVFFVAAFLATNLFGLIAGSAHDFSTTGWTADNRICLPCHTPHNADLTVADAPLWNHLVTIQAFVPYGATLAGTAVGAPAGLSLLCLSCHDGVTNVDAFGGSIAGAAGSQNISAWNPATTADLGLDMGNDHPVGFVYDDTVPGIHALGTATALGGTIQTDLLAPGDMMECSSCHDVHNEYNNLFLLNIDNTASALCLTCHDK